MAPPRIGLALGGGFARGIAHAGVLRVFERHGIPIHCITGVSAGSIVAAAYASGAQPEEIARAGLLHAVRRRGALESQPNGICGERAHEAISAAGCSNTIASKRCGFRLAWWRPTSAPVNRCPSGIPVTSSFRFERAAPTPVCSSRCASGGRVLVDGAMSTEIPALLARELGATHVVSVHLPAPSCQQPPADVFQVVRRCFQIMQIRNEDGWRQASDLVITPDLQAIEWDGFECGPELVKAGEAAAFAVLPAIQSWFSQVPCQFSAGRDAGVSQPFPAAYASPEPA